MHPALYLLGFLFLCGCVGAALILFVTQRALKPCVSNRDIYGNLAFRIPIGEEQACHALMQYDIVADTLPFEFDEKTRVITFRDPCFVFRLFFIEFEGHMHLYAELVRDLRRRRTPDFNRFFAKKLSAVPFDLDTLERIKLFLKNTPNQKEIL